MAKKNHPNVPDYRPNTPNTRDKLPRPTGRAPNQASGEGGSDKKGSELQFLPSDAQNNIVLFARTCVEIHKRMSDMQEKLNAIDEAYYRYTATKDSEADCANAACANVFDDDDITPPIVISQVDTYVAYLADIFVTGSPMFPVVSNPLNRIYAEQLETLLDDHASLGSYPRHILKFLRDAVKYNYAACEVEWTSIRQFAVSEDIGQPNGKNVKKGAKKFNKIKPMDMRNTYRDPAVDPGSISEEGDYAGYIEILSKTKLIRLMDKLEADGKLLNRQKAMASGLSGTSQTGLPNFTDAPQLSNYGQNVKKANGPNGVWGDYFMDTSAQGRGRVPYGAQFEVTHTYARIIPRDMGLGGVDSGKQQIWKFIVVNDMHVISAERIISAYDFLPILFAQPFEDGLGDQTQSVAESEIPFQKAAKTLFAIRFTAARRAVSDRALYLEDMISAANVNSPVPAAKIPVRISALSQKKLSDAYHQIPFDMRGTETVLQDAQQIVQFSKELHGANNPRQGMFQKGNKSVREWDDTMAGSDGRMRLPAITLEGQFFSWLKSIMVLNIFQYGDESVVVSQKTGAVLTIDLTKLRQQVLAFKVTDGQNPKAKVASTEALGTGMNLIMNAPALQQAYGTQLPAMFAHFMSLMGVKDLEQYDPAYLQKLQQAQGGNQPEGLMGNMLQAPNMPGSGVPPTANMPLTPPAAIPPSDASIQVP